MTTSRFDNELTMNTLRKRWWLILSAIMWAAAVALMVGYPGVSTAWGLMCTSWVLMCMPEITRAYRRYFPGKLPAIDTPLEVLLIDPDNESWAAKWGLTEERSAELGRIARDVGPAPMADVLVAVSKHCKHPNELMYISYMLGAFNEHQCGAARIVAAIIG